MSLLLYFSKPAGLTAKTWSTEGNLFLHAKNIEIDISLHDFCELEGHNGASFTRLG
jgi:hypothetical protein